MWKCRQIFLKTYLRNNTSSVCFEFLNIRESKCINFYYEFFISNLNFIIRSIFKKLKEIAACGDKNIKWCACSISRYNVLWYKLSRKSTQLLSILLYRCLRPCTLTAGKMFVLSLINYASVRMIFFNSLTCNTCCSIYNLKKLSRILRWCKRLSRISPPYRRLVN